MSTFTLIRSGAVAVGVMLTVGLVTALRASPDLITWDKDNPYQTVVTQWLALPSEQRNAISEWSEPVGAKDGAGATLSAEQEQIVAHLATAVQRAAQDPREAKWLMTLNPNDPDNPAAMTLPYLSPLMALGKITIKTAATESPSEAINRYLAVTQMGRTLRQNCPLIDQLTGINLERQSNRGMADRLGEFSAADLDRLARVRAGLKPVLSFETALREGERNQFFYPMLDRLLGPGLAALLEENARLEKGAAPALEDEVVTSLRLSGIITGGDNMIGLERTQDGSSFWVREGQTVQGVKLQSIDRSRKLAYILIGKQNAVVQLASKQVLICRPGGDAKRLREMLDLFDKSGPSQDEWISQIMRSVGTYPNGLKGYLDHLRLEYDQRLMQAVQYADQVKVPTASANVASLDDPLLNQMTPAFSKVGRTMNSANLEAFMMDAALQLRRQELAGLPLEPPMDPWASEGTRLKLDRTADGRFTLGSVYEKKAGEPLEVSFGGSN